MKCHDVNFDGQQVRCSHEWEDAKHRVTGERVQSAKQVVTSGGCKISKIDHSRQAEARSACAP
eukprot:1153316-Pelagomonas_calceolata.AAC.4